VKIVKLIVSLSITIGLIILLSTPLGGKPAFGKLLNPVSGFWANAESRNLHIDSEIAKLPLNDEVVAYFDERRVPHIFANNEYDLYFTQGYIVASLRLWQMEFQVMAAEGRVSEILGDDPRYLEFDKKQRRKGLKFGAQNKTELMMQDPLARELINAYTDGINEYIKRLPAKKLPLEYKLIGYKPELWSPYKTALFLMNMSDVLTSTEYDIEYSNFVFQHGSELFHQLYNDWFPENDPVLHAPEEGWLAHFGLDTSAIPGTAVLFPGKTPENTNATLGILDPKPDVQIGSNNWALHGNKTLSSYPLLANDPHLRLTFPSVWIEMHLVGPQSNAYGASFPGAPAIIIGFNEKIGWGVTNAGRDVKDWYVIEYKDNNKDFYRWEDGWRETKKVVEEYKVKGGQSVYDTIIFTHLGPVVHENFETNAGKLNLALQWMAHYPSEEYKTFYLLNRAENFEQYLEALTYYSCPAQNFVFACVDGDIALRQQGKFPVLEKHEGLTIEDGSKREKWSRFIPFEHIPMEYNPASGFVSSANQHAVDTTYPYYTNGVYEYYRNRVINDELSKLRRATVEDMKALQYNNYNLLAAENLPLLLDMLSTFKMNFKEQEIFESLRKWDFYNHADDINSTYFQIFYERFFTLLWDEFTEEEVAGSWENFKQKDGYKAPGEFKTYKIITDSIYNPFISHEQYPEIKTYNDIAQLAFKHAVERIEKIDQTDLPWGKYKNTLVEHIAMIPAFSANVNTGGNYKVVNATGKYHGPSWRMILDFADGKVSGLGVYPGGQSGNPGSYYYDNQLKEWTQGIYHELINSSSKADFENERYRKVTFKN
jgi:penicillin G amidase